MYSGCVRVHLCRIDIQHEEREVGATNAGNQWYKVIPLHVDMTAKVRYLAVDLNLRILRRHGGDGSNCKLGHVRADLIDRVKVNFPRRPVR